MRYRVAFCFFLGAVVFVATTVSISQSTTAQISGTITDSSGAVVAGATITATNTETSLERAATSNDLGFYTVPLLPPGEYTLKIQAPGFRLATRSGVQLAVREVVRLDFSLAVGELTEVMEVKSAAPLLQSETGTISTVVGSKAVAELPLVSGVSGRDPVDLLHILPGATNRGIAGTQSVNGGRVGSNDIQLDGVSKQLELDGVASGARGIPSVDAVSEVKLMTNVYSAEYGRSGGGTVVLTVKPGTNEFHGNLHHFFRHDKLAARNFFAPTKLPLRSNMYGGTFGGPIIKRRTFFFVSYEGWRFRTDSNIRTTVPTDREKSGDFSDTRNGAGNLIPIYDPATLRPNPSGTGFLRDPFPNNVIPIERIDPVVRKLLPYYESANLPGAPFTRANNFRVTHLTGRDLEPQVIARVDHQLNSNNTLSGRFFYHHVRQENAIYFENEFNPGSNNPDEWNKNFVLVDTHVFSPTLLNEARFGVNRQLDTILVKFPAEAADLIGLKGLPGPTQSKPRFDIAGVSSLGGGENWKNVMNVFEGSDTITHIRGRHNLKMGFNYRRFQFNRHTRSFLNSSTEAGVFSFSGVFTNLPGQPGSGYAFADFLLGMPASANITLQPSFGFRSWYGAGFIQDDFKVSSSLTLNLGLRYDIETPFSEVNNKMSLFDGSLIDPVTTRPGALQFAGRDGSQRLVETDKNNWGPRFGFAWSPLQRSGVVIRGGFGVLYAPYTRGQLVNPTINSGFSATTTFSTLDNLTPPFTLAQGLPFYNVPAQNPSASFEVGQTAHFVNRANRSPYVQQWSLGVEKELSGSILVDVSYVGTKGTKLFWGQPRNFNQLSAEQLGPQVLERVPNPFAGLIQGSLGGPTITRGQLLSAFPQYLSVLNWREASANSIYHSLQAKVEKRFSHGLHFIASYTGSKLLTDSPVGGAGVGGVDVPIQNAYNLKAEKGRSTQDISQRFVGLLLYELPFGKGQQWANAGGWKDVFLGGWQINTMWTAQTGLPLTIFNNPNLTSSQGGGSRPNRICDGNLPESERSINRYFDTSCFAAPPAFAFGNSGSGIIMGPGLFNIDFSTFKNFRITERLALQFRAEFFNVFNHTNFGNPGTTRGIGNFGVIASTNGSNLDFAGGPRVIQFGLKIIF